MPTRKIENSDDGNREDKSDKDESVGIRTLFEKLIGEKKTGGQHEDFELPGYLKKMKYMLYVPIKRNIYLTKKRIEDDGIFCSCSSLSGKSTVCDGDCHCGMLFSSCSYSCKCGSSCNNKPFQHRPVKKLKLVKTKKCGFGLITDEDIKTGDFVIEYVGEVIDDKTCEERLWTMKHRGDTNFYLCEVNHDMVIDATYKGNRSRFINHSCEPNTEMQKWFCTSVPCNSFAAIFTKFQYSTFLYIHSFRTIEGETRIGIFATRNIKKGDNLTYDYQFVQFGADQDCFCGALSCRQKLGSKFSKLKESDASFQDLPNGKPVAGLPREAYHRNCIDVVIRIWNPQHKKYYGGVIIDFDSCTCKHTILFEDERIEKVDMSRQDWSFL